MSNMDNLSNDSSDIIDTDQNVIPDLDSSENLIEEDNQFISETPQIIMFDKDIITIQTHDGRFHVDDVGSVSLLSSYFSSQNKTINLVRSRKVNPDHPADIYVDVGLKYDPPRHCYDHHQHDCDEVFDEGYTILLSSIGMVWKHFGKEILQLYIDHKNYQVDNIDVLWREIYHKTIQEIDGYDNGISPVDGGNRNYWTYMNIGSIISSMNTMNTNNEDDQMIGFQKAVKMFGVLYDIRLNAIITKHIEYQTGVKLIESNLDDNGTKDYIYIKGQISVSNTFKALNYLDPDEIVKFVIYVDSEQKQFTVRGRSVKYDRFTQLVPLLDSVRAREALGDNLIFVHNKRFIGKTTTLESALELIKLSFDDYENTKIKEKQPDSYFKLSLSKLPIVGKIQPKDWLIYAGIGIAATAGTLLVTKTTQS